MNISALQSFLEFHEIVAFLLQLQDHESPPTRFSENGILYTRQDSGFVGLLLLHIFDPQVLSEIDLWLLHIHDQYEEHQQNEQF